MRTDQSPVPGHSVPKFGKGLKVVQWGSKTDIGQMRAKIDANGVIDRAFRRISVIQLQAWLLPLSYL